MCVCQIENISLFLKRSSTFVACATLGYICDIVTYTPYVIHCCTDPWPDGVAGVVLLSADGQVY